nr:pancreatic triacylglycerol lipase-like [Onthophagus taurus]
MDAIIHGNVQADDIRYFLWNRDTNQERISINNYGNNIDRNAPVKILIHGWMHDINSFWYSNTRQAYVASGANVIAIDWSRHSQQIVAISINRLPNLGEFVAKFVLGLSESQGIPMTRIHILGHSLGAHLAGFAGKSTQRMGGRTLGRITGLDPADIGFTNAVSTQRLDKSDAERVDTILTDAGIGGAGINRSLGHVNFWPNGGIAVQPGCFYYPCSHNRAPIYFTEGILSDLFVSTLCSSYTQYFWGTCRNNPRNIMGERTNFQVTGDFYLTTNVRSPFARG